MFCKNCGSEINDSATLCPTCGMVKGQGFGYCQNCGANIEYNSNFCSVCGFRTTAQNDSNVPNDEQQTAATNEQQSNANTTYEQPSQPQYEAQPNAQYSAPNDNAYQPNQNQQSQNGTYYVPPQNDNYAYTADASNSAPNDYSNAQYNQNYQNQYNQNYQYEQYQQPQGEPYQNQQYGAPYGQTQKSRIAAGLLGIFLGTLGVHNFYLGNTGRAVTQLLISILLSWTVIAPVAIEIWALIEGIQILTGSINTDANGVPLSN